MKNDIIRGKCIDISFEGKGVAKTEEGIIFVDGHVDMEKHNITEEDFEVMKAELGNINQ